MLNSKILAEPYLSVVGLDCVYPAVQLSGGVDIFVMLMQRHLHGNRQGEKIAAGTVALPY